MPNHRYVSSGIRRPTGNWSLSDAPAGRGMSGPCFEYMVTELRKIG